MAITQPIICGNCLQLKIKLFRVSINAKKSCNHFRCNGFIGLFAPGFLCCCNSSQVENLEVKRFNIYCYKVCLLWNNIDGSYFIAKELLSLVHKMHFQLQLIVGGSPQIQIFLMSDHLSN